MHQKKNTTIAYSKDAFSQLTLHSNKDFAARLFLMAMRKADVNMLIRKAMHQAVVTYGWGSYTDSNQGVIYPKPDHITFNPQRNYLFFRNPGEVAIEPLGKEPTLANVQFPNIKRAYLGVTI